SCFVCRNGVFCYSLFIKRLPLLYLVWRLDRECHQCPAVLHACAPPRVETVLLRILPQPLCVCISISVSAPCCLSCVCSWLSPCAINSVPSIPQLEVCSFRDRIPDRKRRMDSASSATAACPRAEAAVRHHHSLAPHQ